MPNYDQLLGTQTGPSLISNVVTLFLDIVFIKIKKYLPGSKKI